jgi:hypothetical protein
MNIRGAELFSKKLVMDLKMKGLPQSLAPLNSGEYVVK